MLQYEQASLTTPTHATELTGVDLEQVMGGFDGLGLGGDGFSPLGLDGIGGFNPFGFGTSGLDGFGPGNTILINVDSINKNRRPERHHHRYYSQNPVPPAR